MADGLFYAVSLIEPDQLRYVVLRCKPFDDFFAVLVNASCQVVSHPNIERSVALTGEDVDKISHALKAKSIHQFCHALMREFL